MKDDVEIITFEEFGITDDVWSNFLIDCWENEQERKRDKPLALSIGEPVTVILTTECYKT